MKSTIPFLAAISVVGVGATAVTDKITLLRQQGTQVERIGLLEDADFVFNFLNMSNGGVVTGAGGHTVEASSANFPAVIGNGMAMTIGFLGPCGMNTPHTHPRATEFNFVVNGSLTAGMLAENGARFVTNNVSAGSATIFPKGAIHFEVNNDCDPALFVAGFNNEDPGVLQMAQRFFGLPPDIVSVTLNDLSVDQIAALESMLPDNIVQGLDECLSRCGIKRIAQPSTQRQPRLPGNALPAGFLPPPPAASQPPLTLSTLLPAATGSYSLSGSGALGATSSSSSSRGGLQPATLALIIIVTLMALGYVGLAIMYFIRRRQDKNPRWHRVGSGKGTGDFSTPMMTGKGTPPPEDYRYDPPSSEQ